MDAKKNYLNGHVHKESPLIKRPHLSSLHSPRFSNYIAAHSLEELTIYTQIEIKPANIDNCWYFPLFSCNGQRNFHMRV